MPKQANKTVYVVTSGEYSSYSVVAVFDSRELAEEANHYGNDIEEYTLNPGEFRRRDGLRLFQITMGPDGTTYRVHDFGWAHDEDDTEKWTPHTEPPSDAWKHDWTVKAIAVEARIWATSEDHAVKILNEKRGQWIANGRWETEASVIRAWRGPWVFPAGV